MIGKTLGKYKIEEKLGQGGMGTVYKGQDQVLGRPVAIKVLSETASQNQEMIQRFSVEARAAAKLEHPNIVQVYDFFKADNQYFLVLQYVDGQSLADLIKKRGPLPVSMAIKIMIPSLMALHKAHSQGIVHRDIKPDNIMISKEGVVKVADFGIAKLKNEATKLTVTGQIMGTPHYMSPEQCMGESSIDRRSDLYSLGVTFYYMLAGAPPFDADSALVILNMQVGKPLPNLLEKRFDVSPTLWAVILKMTAKNPQDRFQAPGEVVQALRSPEILQGGTGALPVMAREAVEEKADEEGDYLISEAPTLYQSSPSLSGTPTAVSRPSESSRLSESSPHPQDQKKLFVGLAIGVLALVVFFLFFKALSGPAKKTGTERASGTGQGSGQTGSGTEKTPKNSHPKKGSSPTKVVHVDPLKWLPDSLSILIQLNLQTYSAKSDLDRQSIKNFRMNLQGLLEKVASSKEDCASFVERVQRVQLAVFSEEEAMIAFLYSRDGRVFFSQTREKAKEGERCSIEKREALKFFHKNKPHYLYPLGDVLILSNSETLCREMNERACSARLTRSFASTGGYSRTVKKEKSPLWAYFSKTFFPSTRKNQKFSLQEKGLPLLHNLGEKNLVNSIEVSWDQANQKTLFSVEMSSSNPYHSFFLFDKASEKLRALVPQKALLGRLNFIAPQKNLEDLATDPEILKSWRTLPFYREISKVRLRGSAIFVSPEEDTRTSRTLPVTWYVLLGSESSCRDLLERIKGQQFFILPSEYVEREGLELGYSQGYVIYQKEEALFFGLYPERVRKKIEGTKILIQTLKEAQKAKNRKFERPRARRMRENFIKGLKEKIQQGASASLQTLPLNQPPKNWPKWITGGGCSQIHFLRNAEKDEDLFFKTTHRERGVSIETNAPVLQALLQGL